MSQDCIVQNVKRTKAGIALRDRVQELRAKGTTQNAVARMLECDSGNFSKILDFKKLPGRALSLRIARKFRIPILDWEVEVDESPESGRSPTGAAEGAA
jgi:transcriptional regulator with XRE-family HTH domain